MNLWASGLCGVWSWGLEASGCPATSLRWHRCLCCNVWHLPGERRASSSLIKGTSFKNQFATFFPPRNNIPTIRENWARLKTKPGGRREAVLFQETKPGSTALALTTCLQDIRLLWTTGQFRSNHWKVYCLCANNLTLTQRWLLDCGN